MPKLSPRGFAAPLALISTLSATPALACACGCGIFDVGNVTPQSSDSGLSVFVRYDYMDQNQNREAGHTASPDDNANKRISTDFYTIGGNYVINHKWMVMAELPVFARNYTTSALNDAGASPVARFPLTSLGDAELTLTYTGFSPDMATGLGIGVKLPTGRSTSPTYPNFTQNPPYDRDTLPGTGSTDLMVSGYHVGHVSGAGHWFVQAQYKFAVATRDNYRPGNEINAALGASVDLKAGGTTLAPQLSLLASVRQHDSGANADPLNSGYQRLLVAPGLRVALTRKLSVFGDVEFPVAQYVNSAASPAVTGTAGQLAAKALFKLQLNYGF